MSQILDGSTNEGTSTLGKKKHTLTPSSVNRTFEQALIYGNCHLVVHLSQDLGEITWSRRSEKPRCPTGPYRRWRHRRRRQSAPPSVLHATTQHGGTGPHPEAVVKASGIRQHHVDGCQDIVGDV